MNDGLYKLLDTQCPTCGKSIDIAERVNECKNPIREMGVCHFCKTPLIMNGGVLREADLNDLMELGPADTAILERLTQERR